jgi:hypothetical protein
MGGRYLKKLRLKKKDRIEGLPEAVINLSQNLGSKFHRTMVGFA